MRKSASMQKRTSPLKFGDLAEKSGLNSVSNLSTKARARGEVRGRGAGRGAGRQPGAELDDGRRTGAEDCLP